VTLKNKYWTQTFIGSLDIAFITGSAVNIYRRDTFQVYAPTVNNTSAYTMSNYTCKQEQTFSFLNPTSDLKYTGASYKSYTPISFSLYNSLTYSLSAPITITYFQPTTYNFYNGAQITTFVKNKNIYLPTITATDDTFCTLNVAQTLTNKTLTTPTLTNPTIDTITLQTSTGQTNTQLGYLVSNKLTPAALTSSWVSPTGGQITLVSVGVYLLTYAFGVKATNLVLMGCMTTSSTAPYATPQSTDVSSNVFAYASNTNPNANGVSVTNTYVYKNTVANTVIYLYWAGSAVATPQTNGQYFQAVRIA